MSRVHLFGGWEREMVENSAVGLVLLGGEVPVAVTGEEHHQEWLARYPVAPGGQRRVAVSLAWCVIGSGKYRGQYAIEVRLDGGRVGELTYLMSRRYADVLGRVIDGGGTPGCEAVIRLGTRGLEVVLQLPRDPSGVVAASPVTAVLAQPAKRSSRRPVWIAAGAVVFLFVVIGALADDSPPTTNSAASLTTTDTAVPTTTVAPTTTTTTTTTSATTTTTTTTVVPQPPPKPQPNPQPNPATQAPPPAANGGCHPSYKPCVPIAKDVDCEGGSGDGPEYVRGPITVIGPDEYRLDDDKNGIGCQK